MSEGRAICGKIPYEIEFGLKPRGFKKRGQIIVKIPEEAVNI